MAKRSLRLNEGELKNMIKRMIREEADLNAAAPAMTEDDDPDEDGYQDDYSDDECGPMECGPMECGPMEGSDEDDYDDDQYQDECGPMECGPMEARNRRFIDSLAEAVMNRVGQKMNARRNNAKRMNEARARQARMNALSEAVLRRLKYKLSR